MASNIILGSLIACKLLISEPVVENKQEIKEQVNTTNIGNTTINRLTNQLNNQSVGNKDIIETKEEIVIGKVIKIKEKEVWEKQESGKFKKIKKRMFQIKTDNLVDLLLIKEEACGLYEDIIEKDVVIKEASEKIELKEKQEELKKKKVVKKNKKQNNDYEEEYIIVPLDYDLKEKGSYQEIKDDKIKKKINKALISYLNKRDYNINETISEEEKEYLVKKKKQEELLEKVAERQKNLFNKDEEEIVERKSKKEIRLVKAKNDSFLGQSIVANFEDDLAKEMEIEKKIVEEKIEKERKEKEIIVKKKKKVNNFGKLNLIAKAFSFIVKEW